jgi:hypothetical protein
MAGSRVVGRRYKQFDWLHEQLVNKFRFICIPPLPGKQISGTFSSDHRSCRLGFFVQDVSIKTSSKNDVDNWNYGSTVSVGIQCYAQRFPFNTSLRVIYRRRITKRVERMIRHLDVCSRKGLENGKTTHRER